MINGVVIGGFGGHCDLFNYTGMLVAVSTSSGVGVTSIYAMEASPGAPPVVSDIMVQQGGKAGIWQGGMGFATDNNRMFLATGSVLSLSTNDRTNDYIAMDKDMQMETFRLLAEPHYLLLMKLLVVLLSLAVVSYH